MSTYNIHFHKKEKNISLKYHFFFYFILFHIILFFCFDLPKEFPRESNPIQNQPP